ncbi:lipolytic protein G-D-S-L family [Halorhabdus utahensis DSM 12940]|uniref:Lipolytic protein G-D-S-L family n=1 Tax=Halorhabdus utahensis (strain DSM 12940 / JCM 11049 / AX-2) TaxID=519442 RepID=C7NNZ0_HALUD|nr:SGNH/GDSL hydrolase family protein [Halorhabdus utahensis]ACV10281.1 lipolytic protein G-D-S-L family [Halorhabdus utahensis DSM 12940]
MSTEKYPSVSLHNVAELEDAEWTPDGDRLSRVPESVRRDLNEEARHRVRHPTHSEIRFVPEDDAEEIEITLSAPERAELRIFWGSFQPWEAKAIDSTPKTFTLGVPERLAELDDSIDEGRFDPRVCRIAFERFVPVALHDVSGNCRPPTAAELPDQRYLAYGTSITEGAKASAAHLSFVTQIARANDYDVVNLGCSGSAYADPAMAEYIADREDWDVATLALSVNMANAEFTRAEFRERAEYFVNTIAQAHPEKPVVCVTLFPYFADVTESGDPERAEAFRSALRTVVKESPHENVSLVDGTELLDASELTWDILHPADEGMRSIAAGLAPRLDERRK